MEKPTLFSDLIGSAGWGGGDGVLHVHHFTSIDDVFQALNSVSKQDENRYWAIDFSPVTAIQDSKGDYRAKPSCLNVGGGDMT